LEDNEIEPQGADPSPLSLGDAKACRKTESFEQEKYPLLPVGIGERYSKTISIICHAAPLQRNSWALYITHYSED
jgi:hypothetical protein